MLSFPRKARRALVSLGPLLASAAMSLALLSCQKAPQYVVFELPQDFSGPIVLRDAKSGFHWVADERGYRIKVDAPAIDFASYSDFTDRWWTIEAHLPPDTVLPLLTRPASPDVRRGFFGGVANSKGEVHFFVGSSQDANSYFDKLAGR
jgi:hypothetical protein